MAILNPPFFTILRLHQPATEGEITLLKSLENSLGDNFEIYFQPYINGDNPDIAILRKGYGLLIIEVKDWILDYYQLDDKGNWFLRKNGIPIKSPFAQVENYKENLINLHIENLLEKSMKDQSFFGIIHCGAYFHKAYTSAVKDFVITPFDKPEQDYYRKKIAYFSYIGKDTLNHDGIKAFIHSAKMDRPNPLFTEDIYLSFKRHLQPPIHMLEEGKNIVYSREQQVLCRSEENARRKIKGAAGSGKTLVLARRAVNAQKRSGKKVLILTFNLSLRNYIHDRLNDIREQFAWSDFYVTNYHQFFKAEANNHNLTIHSLDAWQDTSYFQYVKNDIFQYDAIFVDEVQDYKTEWLEILVNYFLAENGEFVVFGDEKQNIYDRPLDENKEPTIPTVLGRWNRSLKSTFRLSSQIARLATHFQKQFFSLKYSIEEVEALTAPEIGFGQSIHYIWLDRTHTPEEIIVVIDQEIKSKNIHYSDVAILNSTVEYIRIFEKLFRTHLRLKTQTTFETDEFFNFLKSKVDSANVSKSDKQRKIILDGKLEVIRRNKKLHLYMKTGTTKISTIHSFKGWEIPTLFLIIEQDEENNINTPELVYTGLTRARNNLFILNMGNQSYHNFFTEYTA